MRSFWKMAGISRWRASISIILHLSVCLTIGHSQLTVEGKFIKIPQVDLEQVNPFKITTATSAVFCSFKCLEHSLCRSYVFLKQKTSDNCLFSDDPLKKDSDEDSETFAREDLSGKDECISYQLLTERERNRMFTENAGRCDKLTVGWYRFGGEAGTKLASTCVPYNTCGTSAPGWMNGAHPTVAEGKVTRQVCYNWHTGCCGYTNTIEVLNCGSYYVYKLGPTPSCTLGYCGSDN